MSGQKFTLSFTKTIEKKNLQPSAIRNDAPLEVKDVTETLQSIEENVLKTDSKPEQELVIPLVAADRTSILRRIAEKKLDSEDKVREGNESSSQTEEENPPKETKVLTLDEQAEAAIIEESKKKLEDWSDRGVANNLTISQDASGNSNETEDPLGKESSLDDYDQVDISVFGAALLRGMGWQKSEGIGRGTKKVVEVIDPSTKTFGLASNQGEKGKRTRENAAADEEELNLAKGSYVFIHSGRHRGNYGIVESLDEDHLLVKSAVGQGIIREVELNVRVVSQKEYKDSSRVINKDMYDKFKEEEAKKKEKSKTKQTKSDSEDDHKGVNIKKESKPSDNKGEKTSTNISSKKELEYSDKDIKKERTRYEDREKPGDIEDREKRKDKEQCKVDDSKSSRFDEDKYRYGEKSELKGRYNKKSDKYRCEEKDQLDEKYGSIKDKYRKCDSSKEKYKSTYEDKYSSKSKPHAEKRYESYSDLSDSRYSDKYKSENKAHKRKDLQDVEQEYKKAKKSQEQMPAIPWVRENLRVRLINKEYKGGRYHKEKVIVKFVETAESCECVTEEGKTLREVHPTWLETVIPKTGPQNILIVKGKQKGQRGQILQLHKDQEKASVQLVEDRTIILRLHYDDICEYVSRY